MAAVDEKTALRDELVAILERDLEAAERAHQTTREGATHPDARPENDKDTRALEQTYLARGQAMRVEELRTAVADVRAMRLRAFDAASPAALGALLTVEQDGEERSLFFAPHGGGSALAGGAVQVITPKSPLGRALLGKREGDACDVVLGGRARELVVVRVA